MKPLVDANLTREQNEYQHEKYTPISIHLPSRAADSLAPIVTKEILERELTGPVLSHQLHDDAASGGVDLGDPAY